MSQNNEFDRAREALHALSADVPRDDWVKAGMGFHAAGGDFDTFDEWSASAPSYNAQACRSTWGSFKQGKGVGAGTLFKLAAENGWCMSDKHRMLPAPAKTAEPPRRPAPGMSAGEVWSRCDAATAQHPYIVAKQAAGVPMGGLKVLPAGDGLRIAGEPMAGALVVPIHRGDGSLSSLQFIVAPEVAARLKEQRKPGKLNLPCATLEGWHTVGDVVPGGVVYICEGLATAWACWQAAGAAAVVCFGWGRVRAVAAKLRAIDASAKLVLVPDAGKEKDAADIARELRCFVASMPPGEVDNFDANDLKLRDGNDALATLLESAEQPPPPPLPLSVAFADELGDTFTPPDELVEGVLTAGDCSVVYGSSNSGKTFLVIDLACSVARGVEWMGRKTEPGLVVYLAAESPASVRSRLQAYQQNYGVRVPNFAIVQSPIDLFDGEADTDKIIKTVRQIEHERGIKARLIIGDTLARLSAGANENAGQDMGLVVRRFDRIRTECNAHFCLIHHSGKAAAAGARGWSGIQAAVDTEIEITDSPAGRCCEITKQRDLSTKGERIGFELQGVTLGVTKWGAPATSCVVVAADAPDKPKGKRMGEAEGAVMQFMAANKTSVTKAEVATHFNGRYERSNIYRVLRALVKAQLLHEVIGRVVIAGAAKCST